MCTGLIQTQHTCRASHWDQKCHRWALEGLGPSSDPKLQNLDSFTGWKGVQPLGILGLMIFIDCSGLDRHLALGSSRKHAHGLCVMSHCSDPVQVEGRSCMRISLMSTLTPDCFAPGWSWISLMVFPEGALHVHLPHQVWPQRSKHWRATPANVMCWNVQKCALLGKGFGA